jgi:hypothetical protein
MIRKEHGKFVLRDRAGGHVLGRHATKAAAKRQETAVNLSRARQAGHRVPPPPVRRRPKR